MNLANIFESKLGKLYLLLIWLTFALSGWVTIEPAPVDLLVTLAFVIALFSSYLSFHSHVAFPLTFIWIFILQNIGAMYFMRNHITGFSYFFITLYLIILWVMIVGLISRFGKKMTKLIISGYTTAAIISALLGIMAYFNLLPNAETFMYLGRIKSLFKDPNVFGPFLIPIVLFAINYFEEATTRKKKLFWVSTITLLTIAVFLSFSRAAWINYVISLGTFFFFWILFSTKKRSLVKRMSLLSILFILFAAMLFTLFNNESINSMFNTRFGLQKYDTNRFATQLTVLNSLETFPLGKGPGQSDSISDYSPHSLYVRVLGEYGYLGFFSIISFIILTLLRAVYAAYKTKATLYIVCTAAIIGLLVNSFVIDTLHWRHFWLLLAIPWVYKSDSNKTASSAKKKNMRGEL
ncbi:hypothetical protein CIB95_10455 [Lottiidibacillus patelloidae]|uniref:O-antigen ligase-related domain-containing protein n=1 Tax=Lottiidibacillus patelloidae TaxID=2670334 RepID=A0A263BTC8_9BACI|nr:O-antigen ligase family protein [Lottiidibacillus patelloidae]OZM56637.1 hypothetical protein CIB95_10455 [Lottiidibacillus patelloidae]